MQANVRGGEASITGKKKSECRIFCLSFHKTWQFTLLAFHTNDVYLEKHSLVIICFVNCLESSSCKVTAFQHTLTHLIKQTANILKHHALTNKLTTFSFLFTVILLTLSSQFCFVTAVTMFVFALQQVQFTHVVLMNWYQQSDTIICSTGLPKHLLTKCTQVGESLNDKNVSLYTAVTSTINCFICTITPDIVISI